MKATASRLLRVASCALAGLLGLTSAASAAPVVLDTLLRAPVPKDTAAFGASVALSADGQTALIGARDESRTFGGLDGAAYVFRREGEDWGPGRLLISSETDSGDRFGGAVALTPDGSLALIGAYAEDCGPPLPSFTPGCGAAYIFAQNGAEWVEEAELTAPTSPTDLFGSAVALAADGSTTLVASPLENCGLGEACGAVYVYVRSGATWIQQIRLTASVPQALAEFGASVALSGDGNIAFIGAHRVDCAAGPGCGAVYVFLRSGGGWAQVARLTASDPEIYKLFGTSVALSGDGSLALIGAAFANCNGGEDCGSAYLFVRGLEGWTETQRIAPSDPTHYAQFGATVALAEDGSAAFVGAPTLSCSDRLSCGAVYRFMLQNGLWVEDSRITVPSPPGRGFGSSLAFSLLGPTLLVGAPTADCPPRPPCGGSGCFAFDSCGAAYSFGELSDLAIPAVGRTGLFLLIGLLAAAAVLRLRAVSG